MSADDVTFDVEISTYVASGKTWFRWTILDHNAKGYVGDYSGHKSYPDKPLHSRDEAEASARDYVNRIREAVQLKLNAPGAYRITL